MAPFHLINIQWKKKQFPENSNCIKCYCEIRWTNYYYIAEKKNMIILGDYEENESTFNRLSETVGIEVAHFNKMISDGLCVSRPHSDFNP